MLVKLTSLKLRGPGIPLGAEHKNSNVIDNNYSYTLEVEVSAVIVAIVDPAVLMALTVMV